MSIYGMFALAIAGCFIGNYCAVLHIFERIHKMEIRLDVIDEDLEIVGKRSYQPHFDVSEIKGRIDAAEQTILYILESKEG